MSVDPRFIKIWEGLPGSARGALLAWNLRAINRWHGGDWMTITAWTKAWFIANGQSPVTRSYRWTVKPLVQAGLLCERRVSPPGYRLFYLTKMGREMVGQVQEAELRGGIE